jgi:hypothetical protein
VGPEPLSTPNKAADSILRHAATPFDYQGAVRALLGMPGAEGESPILARTVPPVGFRYDRHPPTDAASPIVHPFEDAVSSPFDEVRTSTRDGPEGMLAGAAPDHRWVESLRKWLMDTPPPSPPTTAAPMPSTPAQPPGAQSNAVDRDPSPAVDARSSDQRSSSERTASERDRGSVVANPNAGQPGDVLERTTIAVPGISERSQYFPALAAENPADRPSGTAAEPPARQAPTGDPYRQTAIGSPSTERAYGTPKAATLAPELQPWHIPSPATQPGEAESIEQLQRTVRELAAQVASWQVRQAHAGQPRQREPRPPRPAERVVIIKQAAQHSGPPRAFWERNYLGHLSWRSRR